MTYQEQIKTNLLKLTERCSSDADPLTSSVQAQQIILLSAIADELHQLNATLREIWKGKTSFPAYLQDMRRKHGVKISEIAAMTGISRSYLYKIMHGEKKTAIRDYVILICCATGMNLEETNTAMDLNGMEILKEDDARDQIIIRCINDNRVIRMINESLEEAGYPWLKACDDMPAYDE